MISRVIIDKNRQNAGKEQPSFASDLIERNAGDEDSLKAIVATIYAGGADTVSAFSSFCSSVLKEAGTIDSSDHLLPIVIECIRALNIPPCHDTVSRSPT